MDDNVALTELSVLLTGLFDQLLNDPEDRALNAPIAGAGQTINFKETYL